MWLILGVWFAAFADGGAWSVHCDTLSHYVEQLADAVVAPDGEIYLLDSEARRIVHLDAQGREIAVFGQAGEGPGEMSWPHALQYLAEPGLLIVLDESKAKPIAFDRAYQAHEIDVPAQRHPLLLSESRYIHILKRDVLREPGAGAWIRMVDPDGSGRVLLHLKHGQVDDPPVVEHVGERGWMPFPWTARALTALSPDGRYLFLGANSALDIRVFDTANGAERGRITGEKLKRPLLTENDLSEHEMGLRVGGKTFFAPDFEQPYTKPPISDIIADTQGRVWIKLNQAYGSVTAEYRVYGQDGDQTGSLHLAVSKNLIHANATHIWTWQWLDDEETFAVSKQAYSLNDGK